MYTAFFKWFKTVWLFSFMAMSWQLIWRSWSIFSKISIFAILMVKYVWINEKLFRNQRSFWTTSICQVLSLLVFFIIFKNFNFRYFQCSFLNLFHFWPTNILFCIKNPNISVSNTLMFSKKSFFSLNTLKIINCNIIKKIQS